MFRRPRTLSPSLLPRVGFAARIFRNFVCVGGSFWIEWRIVAMRTSLLLRAAYVAHPAVWHHTAWLCFSNVRVDVVNKQQIRRRKHRLSLGAAHFAFGCCLLSGGAALSAIPHVKRALFSKTLWPRCGNHFQIPLNVGTDDVRLNEVS